MSSNNIVQITGLEKSYEDFRLKNISFNIPKGSIVGLVGENGAGKSTIINLVLDIIKKERGSIEIFGKEQHLLTKDWKEQIGVILDSNNFPESLNAKQLCNVFKKIYSSWDSEVYFDYLEKLNIPLNKKNKEFSKGMLVKYAIAVALSHKPDLLILDEATNGLDPIVRNEMMDLFLEFVQDENHGILFSSHITADLERIADYIVFISDGEVVFSESKDVLIYEYGILKCGKEYLDTIDHSDIIAYKEFDYEYQFLIKDKELMKEKYKDYYIDNVSIDEIIYLYIKGERF